jgi:hypothetical protein
LASIIGITQKLFPTIPVNMLVTIRTMDPSETPLKGGKIRVPV